MCKFCPKDIKLRIPALVCERQQAGHVAVSSSNYLHVEELCKLWPDCVYAQAGLSVHRSYSPHQFAIKAVFLKTCSFKNVLLSLNITEIMIALVYNYIGNN